MKTTHIKALPDFTGRIVNFIKAPVVNNRLLVLKTIVSIGSAYVHSNGFDLPFLHSVVAFPFESSRQVLAVLRA